MLTETDKATRKGRITASIAPAILSESPFGTPFTAFLEIMDLPREDISDRDEILAGNFFEDGVCQFWLHRVGRKAGLRIEQGKALVHPTLTWLAATPDRFVYDGAGKLVAVLQAKTSGHSNLDAWRDRDSHETTIPEHVIIQEVV